MKRTFERDDFTQIVVNLIRLSGLLESAGDALTRPTGQSAARWKVMGGLDETPKTVADIARSLNVSRQGIQRIADALTRDGLTRYKENGEDKRADLLGLTSRGKEILAQIQAAQRKWADRAGKTLGRRAMAEIDQSLTKLIAVLDISSGSQKKD